MFGKKNPTYFSITTQPVSYRLSEEYEPFSSDLGFT